MSVNFGSTNSSRYYSVPDNADFTLPDGDWTWIGVVKPQATTDPKYIVSTGNFQTANSFNLLGAPSTNNASVAYNTNANLTTGSAIPVNAWSVVYAARRSNLLYVGWKPQGGGTGDESSGQAISGTSDGTALILAGRADLNTARMWKGSISWIALLKGKGLTATEVNDLASGATVLMNAPYAAQVSNLWWLQSSTPSTVTDSVNGRIATKQGTGYSADDIDPLPPIAASLDASPCDQTDNSDIGLLTQTHVLSASNSTQADVSGTGAITSSKDLTAANCTQTDTAATVQISQTHELTVAGSVQTDASGTGAIEVGGISLAALSCEQTDASGAGSLTQAHALSIAISVETDASSSGALTQIHVLSVANSVQTDASSTGAITSSGDLTAANCLQTDTSTTGTITQTHSITAENSTQTDISGTGAIDVGSVINLTAANNTQNDACQTAIITQTHLLIIAPSVQDDVAATSSIVQQHILVCANSIQWDACSTGNLIGDNVILPTSSRITGGMFKGEISSHGL